MTILRLDGCTIIAKKMKKSKPYPMKNNNPLIIYHNNREIISGYK